MTEIAFHFNVPDKQAYSCRLLRKANASNAKVAVVGTSGQLSQLDELLWTFSPVEFIPHKRWSAGVADKAEITPVILAENLMECPHHDVLVNLGSEVPQGFERFERLFEIVTGAEDDRQAARRRWKHYADRGYVIKQHDIANAGAAA